MWKLSLTKTQLKMLKDALENHGNPPMKARPEKELKIIAQILTKVDAKIVKAEKPYKKPRRRSAPFVY